MLDHNLLLILKRQTIEGKCNIITEYLSKQNDMKSNKLQ